MERELIELLILLLLRALLRVAAAEALARRAAEHHIRALRHPRGQVLGLHRADVGDDAGLAGEALDVVGASRVEVDRPGALEPAHLKALGPAAGAAEEVQRGVLGPDERERKLVSRSTAFAVAPPSGARRGSVALGLPHAQMFHHRQGICRAERSRRVLDRDELHWSIPPNQGKRPISGANERCGSRLQRGKRLEVGSIEVRAVVRRGAQLPIVIECGSQRWAFVVSGLAEVSA